MARNRPIEVRVGEEVLFGKFAGTEILVDGEETAGAQRERRIAVLESASEEAKAA